MAGVKYEAQYNVTSVDPPELVRFIKEKYPDAIRRVPLYDDGTPITMWNLIPKKLMPPTHLVRYCCECLKESAGRGRIVVTGVRWAESNGRKDNQGMISLPSRDAYSSKLAKEEPSLQANRKGGLILNNDNDDARRLMETCYKKTKTLLNPIIDWEDSDVWEFIHFEKIPYCELYDRGYRRLGCIGCPMSTNAEKELNAYPLYKAAYIRAFERMLIERRKKGLPTQWNTGEEVMDWWLHGGSQSDKPIDGQMSFDEMEG